MPSLLRVGACLSLSGQFALFGNQAARGLEAWQSLDGGAELQIEDDRSDPRTLTSLLPGLAVRCDLLIGPYSTRLARAAGLLAAESGWLVWNQGGAGDDVERAHPGHVVSILTPTSRYADPFLRLLAPERGGAGEPGATPRLCIVHGRGSFGRQVADGAEAAARRLGIPAVRAAPDDPLPPRAAPEAPSQWDLLSAGVFEQDAELVATALRLPNPPTRICAIAAGVRDFARVVPEPTGVYGIAQWFAGTGTNPALGPDEGAFASAYAARDAHAVRDAYAVHDAAPPDYPAVQAAAGAVIATHCARQAGSTIPNDLWRAACALDTSTLFGGFKIDPTTGAQLKHQTVLLRWTTDGPKPAGPSRPDQTSPHR